MSIDTIAAPGEERSFVATKLLVGARVPHFGSYKVLPVTTIDGSLEFLYWTI